MWKLLLDYKATMCPHHMNIKIIPDSKLTGWLYYRSMADNWTGRYRTEEARYRQILSV